MLEAAGFAMNDDPMHGQPSSSSGADREGKVRVRYCDTPMPEKKPILSRNTATGERLFVVSQPENFPEMILQDLFCRFGTMIDAYFMPG